jgi:hypothetical protein
MGLDHGPWVVVANDSAKIYSEGWRSSPKMFVTTYKASQYYNPEDHNHISQRLKTHRIFQDVLTYFEQNSSPPLSVEPSKTVMLHEYSQVQVSVCLRIKLRVHIFSIPCLYYLKMNLSVPLTELT